MTRKAIAVAESKEKYGAHLRKYNPTVLATICRHALQGRSKTDCFKLVGISPDTGWMWLRQGREGKDPLLTQFERVFERCVAKYNAEQLAMITATAQSGAPNTWQAAAWLLERRDPSNWGRRDVTTIEAGDKPLVQLNQVVLVDDDARAAARSLLRRVAGHGAGESIGPGVGGELEEGDTVDGESVELDSREAR